VSLITDSDMKRADTRFGSSMKRYSQFVALLAVILIAAPPALAHDLCALAADANARVRDCCASMTMPSTQPERASSTSLANDCGQSCCSVSSQRLPADRQERVNAEPITAHSTDVADQLVALPPTSIHQPHIAWPARARHLLLHVFLI